MDQFTKVAELTGRVLALEKKCESVIEGRAENGKTDIDFGWRLKIVEDSLKELIDDRKEARKDAKSRQWDVWKIVLAVIITSALTFIIGKIV